MKRFLGASLTLFLGVSFLSLWAIFQMDPNDEKEYQRLLHPKEEEMWTASTSTQHRFNVRKDFLLLDKGQRRHSSLHCKSSDLVVFHRGAESEMAEKMVDLSCTAQMDLDLQKNQQAVRRLEAEKGTLYYLHNRFLLHNVHLARHLLPGTEFPESITAPPTMEGTAKRATLVLDKEMRVQTKNLHMILYNPEDPL